MDEVKRKAIETLKLVARDVVAQAAKTALIDLGAAADSVAITTVGWDSGAQMCIRSDLRTGPHRSRTRMFNITLSETQCLEEDDGT